MIYVRTCTKDHSFKSPKSSLMRYGWWLKSELGLCKTVPCEELRHSTLRVMSMLIYDLKINTKWNLRNYWKDNHWVIFVLIVKEQVLFQNSETPTKPWTEGLGKTRESPYSSCSPALPLTFPLHTVLCFEDGLQKQKGRHGTDCEKMGLNCISLLNSYAFRNIFTPWKGK